MRIPSTPPADRRGGADPAPAARSSDPHDLETIVLKAMAKDPADRYTTAAELAEDLQRFLDDRPILARRPTLADRAGSGCGGIGRSRRSPWVCCSSRQPSWRSGRGATTPG